MSERGGDDAIDVAVLFHQVYSAATERLDVILRPMDLTARHLSVMFLIRDGVQTQRDLVARLGVDKTGMVRTVDDLERRGYVSRTPSVIDRRVGILELSADGVQALRAAQRHTRAVADQLFGAVSAEELTGLKSMLTRTLDVLRSVNDAGRASPSQIG